MSKITGIGQVEVIAERAKNLDTINYRGSAPLAHLALISRADVYDAVTNPDGLQRDLSPTHASQAYDYAHRGPEADRPRAFPEVVLNVRDKRAVTIETLPLGAGALGSTNEPQLVRLRFDLAKTNLHDVDVSRVDGNHRLYYAAGDERRDPILASAPFQIHVGLTRAQEASLFVDINANQKGLNSSHLSVLRSNLTDEQIEIRDHPGHWMREARGQGHSIAVVRSRPHGWFEGRRSHTGAHAHGELRKPRRGRVSHPREVDVYPRSHGSVCSVRGHSPVLDCRQAGIGGDGRTPRTTCC